MEDCQAAVTHVRSQAAAVRKTASEYLKGELLRGEHLANGDPKWPAVLGSFHVAANQVTELIEGVDPVLSYFAYQPIRATAKSGDIPMFLSTKLLQRNDGDLLGKPRQAEDADGTSIHPEDVERYNECVSDISRSYQAAANDVLRRLASSSRRSR